MLDFLNSYKGIAIIDNNKEYSFEELIKRVNYYIEILINYSNCNISVVSEFNFESAALFLAFAVDKNKNTFIPITPNSENEIQNKITFSNTNIIFRFINEKNKFEIIILNNSKNSKNNGLILFSSGTTGSPKMMYHQFDNLFKIFENINKRQRSIKILLFLMFDHIGGINTFLNCLKDGSTIVIPRSRSVEYIADLINIHEINVLPTTPTFLNLLLINIENIKHKLTSLKLISYGTERMPNQLLLKLRSHLPAVKLLQTFGTSETGILRTTSKSSDSLYFKIDDDRYEYKIENNILFIKSNLNITGYINQSSDNFSQDGWYQTGDIVNQDEDGFITIIGRINEIINVGGLKVMPIEIENVLNSIYFIKDCMVFGEKNPITGQMVSAKIVVDQNILKDNNSNYLKKEIREFCRDKLEKYKIPVRIEIVDNLIINSRFKKNIR